MRKPRWEAPFVQLDRPTTRYLHSLVMRDIQQSGSHRMGLTREEAIAFAAFLSDFVEVAEPPRKLALAQGAVRPETR